MCNFKDYYLEITRRLGELSTFLVDGLVGSLCKALPDAAKLHFFALCVNSFALSFHYANITAEQNAGKAGS